MKSFKILLEILLLTVSSINCQERRLIFANNIKTYVQNIPKPTGVKDIVSDFDNKLFVLFYTLTLKELQEAQIKFALSDNLVTQIKLAPLARSSGSIKVEETAAPSDFYTYEQTLGSAIKEDDGKISFALIKSKSNAKLITRYEKIYRKECHKVWIFFNKCKEVEYQSLKPITEDEKILINNAAQYSAKSSIIEGVDILKKDDFQLYMSDSGTFFSPDRQSVVHITSFGNIAIGPSSELNAILPLKYEYVDSSINAKKIEDMPKGFTRDTGILIEYPKGNFTEQEEYPIMPPNVSYKYGKNLYLNSGLFHKFHFLINNKNEFSKFPRQYFNYMNEISSNKGPFIFEIKKNGNVIFYEKKTNKIIWQTNTANKGNGPYNFYITNDKILILEDSNGKIIYKSNEYKEMPSILYGNSGKNGVHVYNGYLINKIYREFIEADHERNHHTPPRVVTNRRCVSAFYLHIMTDNDKKYKITYGGRIMGTNKWFSYDNRGNYNNELYKNDGTIDMFYANLISDNNEYDICYAACSSKNGWTSIGCNGEKVGESTGNSCITNLIIYFKEKGEFIPSISSKPKIISS